MGLVLSVCDYIYVLDFGKIIAAGTPAEIRESAAVKAAYLGEQAGEIQAQEGERMRTQQTETGKTMTETTVESSTDMDTHNGNLVEIENLSAGYAGVAVIRGVNLHVARGKLLRYSDLMEPEKQPLFLALRGF